MRARSGGAIHWLAECYTCGWTNGARNAQGSGAQHAEKHGHRVYVEIAYGYMYEGSECLTGDER